jgi:hypothetical protein
MLSWVLMGVRRSRNCFSLAPYGVFGQVLHYVAEREPPEEVFTAPRAVLRTWRMRYRHARMFPAVPVLMQSAWCSCISFIALLRPPPPPPLSWGVLRHTGGQRSGFKALGFSKQKIAGDASSSSTSRSSTAAAKAECMHAASCTFSVDASERRLCRRLDTAKHCTACSNAPHCTIVAGASVKYSSNSSGAITLLHHLHVPTICSDVKGTMQQLLLQGAAVDQAGTLPGYQ